MASAALQVCMLSLLLQDLTAALELVTCPPLMQPTPL